MPCLGRSSCLTYPTGIDPRQMEVLCDVPWMVGWIVLERPRQGTANRACLGGECCLSQCQGAARECSGLRVAASAAGVRDGVLGVDPLRLWLAFAPVF